MRTRLRVAILAALVLSGTVVSGARHPATAASWEHFANDCFKVDDYAFTRLVCWRIDRLVGDGSAEWDYWQLRFDAAGHSNHYRKMKKLWVEARPLKNSPRQFDDGIPQPGKDERSADHCRAVSLTVSSGHPISLGIGYSKEICDENRWSPHVYREDGHYSVTWSSNVLRPNTYQAEVGYNHPVRTREGEVPRWDFSRTGQYTD
jgi:hypothetical protein